MTENEVEDKLTSFITVFKYIDDKDVFQKVRPWLDVSTGIGEGEQITKNSSNNLLAAVSGVVTTSLALASLEDWFWDAS